VNNTFRVSSVMSCLPRIVHHFVCLLLCVYMINAPVRAEGKPLLSEEIGAVIETQGIAAAKQRFAEIYPARQDEYEIDVQGMMDLGSGYIQSGNMELGMAVMEMMTTISTDMVQKSMNSYSPEMAEMQNKAREAELAAQEQAKIDREEEKRIQQQAEARARGKARQDLDRFVGIFGDPADTGRSRTLFATVSCDGYLVTGPMWADVGPWWMRSASDTVFTYSDSFTNLSMEFKADGSKLSHDVEGVTSPLERLGPLPADWESCLERPLR